MDESRKETGYPMRILVVGGFCYEMYAPAFYQAWQSMGHRVQKIDYNEYNIKGKGKVATVLNKIQSKYFYGLPLLRYNRDIVKAVENYSPDFVFLYRCDHVFNKTIKYIRKRAIVVSYNNDNPFTVNVPSLLRGNFISNAKYCDLVYVYRKRNMDDFAGIGVNNTKVLLPYYLSNRNYPVEGMERDIPVAFVGHWENDGRDRLLIEMKKAGIPVSIYGADYWITRSQYAEDIKSMYYGLKMGEGYNQLLNRIQVALVFYSQRNKDTYTRRCFEIPATKTLMLSPFTQDMANLFPEGEGVVYYHGKEELIEKCKFLLENPNEIEKIGEKGYKRLKIIGGTEIDRCKEIIEDVLKIKERKKYAGA